MAHGNELAGRRSYHKEGIMVSNKRVLSLFISEASHLHFPSFAERILDRIIVTSLNVFV
jgi:hypothetical protein